MLASLTIKNVVLIDQLKVEFQSGLCALTGETGAGKSILLDSLGLALGARSDAGLVRKGTEQASVIAEFQISQEHPAVSFLEDQDLEAEEHLILRRIISSNGRSKAYINDQPVSISVLKQVGNMLVEIHGQFETQSLLNPVEHKPLLDAYGVRQSDLQSMKQVWMQWKEKEKELIRVQEKMDKARSDEEYLRQAIEDLDELNPQEGEEERLSSLRGKLMKREQYLEALNIVQTSLNETETIIGQGWRALERIGDDAKDLLAGLDRANAEIQEVLNGVQILSAELEESEYSLSDIDDRLFTLKAKARMHGCNIDELAEKREELAHELSLIENQDDILADLVKTVGKLKQDYISKAESVYKVRVKAAQKLDTLVAKELAPLKLDKARFVTSIEKVDEDEWSVGGIDKVRFLVATNPNSDPGPLNKIASGGEMARFMLALKVVMAEIGVAGSLIFDEVDSGIGGSTADAVGERLAKLAGHKQILVVTHSPQVAARAGYHWIVSKQGSKDVKTNVLALPDLKDREEEIARMLSGSEITREARAAAGKLLEGSAA